MISGKNICGRARPFIFYDSYVYPSLFGVNDRQLYRSFYVSFFKASGNIHGIHAISPTIMTVLKPFSCATLINLWLVLKKYRAISLCFDRSHELFYHFGSNYRCIAIKD